MKQFNQKGFSLIEVLISALILGTALLTLSSMQTRSLQFNQGAYLRSQASILAYDIADRIRANRQDMTNYNREFDTAAPSSASNIVQKDLQAWINAVKALLPEGQGKITCNASNVCDIEVRWSEQAATNSGESALTVFKYTSRL